MAVLNHFDEDNSGCIDYKKFCKLVMDSGKRDATSLDTSPSKMMYAPLRLLRVAYQDYHMLCLSS